jgi:hypothetical protein
MPLEAEFWNPCTALPSGMRDAITFFERELARCNGHMMMLGSSRFVGMMEWDPEYVYDLLLMTPENTDSKSVFEGSCHPLRECNMLHLLEDGAAAIGGTEDDAYPIPRIPGEQA